MLQPAVSDVGRALLQADPAGLVPQMILDQVSAALSVPNTMPIHISHRPECSACRAVMSQKIEAKCQVLTTQGLTPAVHICLRCPSRKCKAKDTMIWANFQADARGKHVWIGGSARPDIAMLNPHFGVTWAWHSQFTKRLLHHHGTFLGESLVHGLDDLGLDHGNQRVADAWCKLQLLGHWEHIADSEELFPLNLPFHEILAAHKDKYDALVRRQLNSPGAGSQCLVRDGNQKLSRRTCSELFADIERIPGTGLYFVQSCCKTPKRKTGFCASHQRADTKGSGLVKVHKKDCVGTKPEALIRTVPSIGAVEWPLKDWMRAQVHKQSKDKVREGEDPDVALAADFVSCRTIKMKKRVSRRSGGWLVGCNENGVILGAMEFFGGESLTQRAAFVAKMIGEYPSLKTVVHDDACHLRKFLTTWFKADSPHVCYPAVAFVIDKFHSKAHNDSWCQKHCSPKTKENQRRLEAVNSSACEILFSWLSGYKNAFRHMNRMTGHFFIHELLLLRNAWSSRQRENHLFC